MSEIVDNGPEITFDDVAGLEFAKKTIKEIAYAPRTALLIAFN